MIAILGADGRVRGVASLDSITPDEFSGAFERWPVSLTRIEPADVERAVYEAIRPEIVACPSKGGYQPIKFSLKRQSVPACIQPVASREAVEVLEPMPFIF